MSISKTILAILGTALIGLTTLFASANRPIVKNKMVDITKKKTVRHDQEDLFI